MASWNIETKCVQGGYRPGNGEPREVPIIQSTTFKYDTSSDMAKLFDAEVHVIYVANGEGMSTPDFTVHFNEKNDDTSPTRTKV